MLSKISNEQISNEQISNEQISNEQISNEQISITNPWSGKNINNNIPLDSYTDLTDMTDMSDKFLQKSLTNSNNNDNDIISNYPLEDIIKNYFPE